MSPDTLLDLKARVDNHITLKSRASYTLLQEISEALQLAAWQAERVQQLKQYLALEKFQGTEIDSRSCRNCGWIERKADREDWVAVGDILNRL
jgi:hypothetical protein